MAEDIAISVNDVSKMYKLYDNPMDRLKESLGLSRKKKYKEHYALNHVSFQVHKGETVGISRVSIPVCAITPGTIPLI